MTISPEASRWTTPPGAMRVAFRKLLERSESSILVVTHEIPIRYALNAADGSDDLDGPAHQLANATPYLFDEDALARAVAGIERLT